MVENKLGIFMTFSPCCGQRATIATSIMPRRIEAQQAAIDSWLKLGFEVVSVNVQAEIDALHDLFPGVEFIAASENLGKSHLVSIVEILTVLAECQSTLFGIVNSDIILKTCDGFTDFLLENTSDNALVFGSRIDVDDINSKKGVPYALGYDYFFFRKELLCLQLNDNFFLGNTWWDFWFPISAALYGVKLRQLIVPIGYHVLHDQSWNYKDLEIGMNKFISAINNTLITCNKSSYLTDRIRFIIASQGMDGFVGQIPSVLMLYSELVVHGPQLISVSNMLQLVDILKVHQERYEMFFQSRSWRWTAPARFVTSLYRSIIAKRMKK